MRALTCTAVMLAFALTGLAAAAEPRASLPDIEDEVMCLECGTTLDLSDAPVAERERSFIRREIAAGKSKQEIKDGLVERLGPRVLALPENRGFGRATYAVPALVLLLGLVTVGVIARRGRRPTRRPDDLSAPEPAEALRLERELARYDP